MLTRRALLASGVVAVGAAACGAHAAQRSATSRRPATATAAPTQAPTTTPRPTSSPQHSAPAREIVHGSRSSRDVALTFHTAGDSTVVSDVLATAKQAGAGLTMLVVGTWLRDNPQFARRILADGNDLGNHTWSHPVLANDDAVATKAEVVRCRNLIRSLTGTDGSWFRPSGTPHATELMLRTAGAAGYRSSLSYDVDPLDYTNPGAAAIVARVLAQARGGSIISLHTLYPGTAEALPHVIDGLRSRGLRPVTASALLGRGAAA